MELYNKRELVIKRYITAYNNFDVEGMCATLHKDITFSHIINGEVDMKLQGITAFKEQAILTASVFSKRQQQITEVSSYGDSFELSINFTATVAADLPNGYKKGGELTINGKSVFVFKDEKIIILTETTL
jgi:hypothetical protein